MKKRIKRTLNNFNAAALFQDFIRTAAVYLVATCLALCLNGAEVLNENIVGVYMLAVALISLYDQRLFLGCHCFNRRRYRGKFLLYLPLFCPEFFHYRVPHHLFHNASDVDSDQLCYGKGKNGGIAFRGRQKACGNADGNE